jgi:hemerythrin
MKRYSFPPNLARSHHLAHAFLIKRLVTFIEEVLGDQLNINEIITFCTTWVVGHVAGPDLTLGVFFYFYFFFFWVWGLL